MDVGAVCVSVHVSRCAACDLDERWCNEAPDERAGDQRKLTGRALVEGQRYRDEVSTGQKVARAAEYSRT